MARWALLVTALLDLMAYFSIILRIPSRFAIVLKGLASEMHSGLLDYIARRFPKLHNNHTPHNSSTPSLGSEYHFFGVLPDLAFIAHNIHKRVHVEHGFPIKNLITKIRKRP